MKEYNSNHTYFSYHHHSYELPDEEILGSEKELTNINLEVGEGSINVVGPTGSVTNVIRDTTNRLLQQVDFDTIFINYFYPEQMLLKSKFET